MQIGYKTSYLLLATFLTTKGERLAEILLEDRHVLFSFADSPTLKENVTGFYQNATVGITAFVAAFRHTKDLLRAALEDEKNQSRDPRAELERAGGSNGE